jgi:hypothetical protein
MATINHIGCSVKRRIPYDQLINRDKPDPPTLEHFCSQSSAFADALGDARKILQAQVRAV